MAWTRHCDTCKFYFYDRSTNASDCNSEDPNWTDEEVTKYFENDEPNCPYHKYDWDTTLNELRMWYPKVMMVMENFTNVDTFWDDVRKRTRRIHSDHVLREWEICADNWFEYLTDDRKENVVL